MDRESNYLPCELVHDHHHPKRTQKYRFQAKKIHGPKFIGAFSNRQKPRWSLTRSGAIVLCQNPSYGFIVNWFAEHITHQQSNSLEGPLGPGFDLLFFEKSREYFLSTRALWRSSKVDAAIAIAELPIRFGVIKCAQKPMMSLSSVVSGGHFGFSLFSTSSCCLRITTSASKPWAPPCLISLNNSQTTSKIFVPISIMRVPLTQTSGFCLTEIFPLFTTFLGM